MAHEEKQDQIIESPVVEITPEPGRRLIIHSHIDTKGKMVLNKEEASLFMIELYKFISPEGHETQ